MFLVVIGCTPSPEPSLSITLVEGHYSVRRRLPSLIKYVSVLFLKRRDLSRNMYIQAIYSNMLSTHNLWSIVTFILFYMPSIQVKLHLKKKKKYYNVI